VSLLVARIAPPARFGAVFGMLAIGNSLGAALGPFLSGALFDVTHSYLAIYVVAVTLVAAALVSLIVFLRDTRGLAS
jgi:MFS-type transporter involved in bile tolerance (Atg22 family)